MLSAAAIYADLQDPIRARESLARYEAEMRRRFGERERWPNSDSNFNAGERDELAEKQRAWCAKRERMDEKRRRRMRRLEARANERGGAVKQPWKPLEYPKADASVPTLISLGALRARHFRPLRWIIKNLLPEGTYVLSGRPKLGKSWLGLQFLGAVAEGGQVLTKQAVRGSGLYLALEDNPPRLQRRTKKHQLGALGNVDDKLDFATEWRRLGDGGEDDLEAWIKSHPDAKLIVIDSLEQIRPKRSNNVYETDYNAPRTLKALSDRYGIAILIVMHNKKGKSESGDPLELINTSLGTVGGCDGALVLDKQRGTPDVRFYVRGRDIEEEPDDGYVIQFERASCKWVLLGDAAALATTKERRAIIDAIRDARQPLTAAQVGTATHRNQRAARHVLQALVHSGALIEVDGSHPIQYALAAVGDE